MEKNSEPEQNMMAINVSAKSEAQELYEMARNLFFGKNGYEKSEAKAREYFIMAAKAGYEPAKMVLKSTYYIDM